MILGRIADALLARLLGALSALIEAEACPPHLKPDADIDRMRDERDRGTERHT